MTGSRFARFALLLGLAVGGCSNADDDGGIDTDGSTSDGGSTSTSTTTTTTTTSTSTSTSTTSDGSTGDVVCFEPLVACGGECIDPRTSRTYCGARGDCRDDNAGQVCSASGVCQGNDGCLETCENCGFEDGTLQGWDVDDLSQPFLPVSVVEAGVTSFEGLFLSEPTEGMFAMVHGFDGDGATGASGDAIEVSQEVTLAEEGALFRMDFRLGWDTTFGATKPRLFRLRIDDAESEVGLAVFDVDAIPPNNQMSDAGPRTSTIDLSEFAGQSIRIVLVFTVPEDDTGPAFAQIDNIRFDEVE